MQCIQNYGNSSSSSSDSESDAGESTAHLRPIDTSHSVAKTLMVMAAPAVVPMVIYLKPSFKCNINFCLKRLYITSILL